MPVADKMGLMHSLSLCVLGRPYRCASLEPLGQSWSAVAESCVLSRVAVFLSLGVGENVSEVLLWFLDGVNMCKLRGVIDRGLT